MLPPQVLLGEMSEPKMRGILVGVPYVSYSIGILYVFLFGSLVSWRYVCAMSAVPIVVAFVWLRCLPESPVWLVRQGRLKQAQETLDWLRGGAGSVQVSAGTPGSPNPRFDLLVSSSHV